MESSALTGAQEALPSFQDPPVAEVALTVYFLPALDVNVAHMGLLRERVKGRFPLFQQHPPLPPQQPESLGRTPSGLGLSIQVVVGANTPRCWFLSADETWIMQVQADRVVINWRRMPQGAPYPRFGAVRSVFKREVESVWAFLAEQSLPLPPRLMGEVTYVNTIEAGATWQSHSEVSKIFNMSVGSGAPPEINLEDARWSGRYVFPNRTGEPTGRLYTYVEPVVTFPHAKPAYNFNLVARGGDSPDLNDVLDLVDAGRSVIVRTFAAMTTPEMHEEWGRDDGR